MLFPVNFNSDFLLVVFERAICAKGEAEARTNCGEGPDVFGGPRGRGRVVCQDLGAGHRPAGDGDTEGGPRKEGGTKEGRKGSPWAAHCERKGEMEKQTETGSDKDFREGMCWGRGGGGVYLYAASLLPMCERACVIGEFPKV